jgi:hypothetical protein
MAHKQSGLVFADRAGKRVIRDRGVVGSGPGTPHSWWNPAPEPTRHLLVMTPRIHHLIEALHAGDRDHYPAIFEAHDSELLTA